MAYFSNGTEGEMYQATYCDRCRNWREGRGGFGEGCPVWDVHILFSYDECNSDSNAKKMLDHLIPMMEGGIYADECTMFLQKEEER